MYAIRSYYVASHVDPRTERDLLRRIGIDCIRELRGNNTEITGSGQANEDLTEIRAAIDDGDLDRALARIEKIERRAVAGKTLKKELAKLYLELSAFGSLHDTIEDLLAAGTTDPEALCLAGPAYLAANEPDKARLSYNFV